MNTLSSSPQLPTTQSRRPRRKKTVSSLQGMFDEPTDDAFKSNDFCSDSFDCVKGTATGASLRSASRKLRQTKRRLFLKSVEDPGPSGDKLTEVLMKLSLETTWDDLSASKDSLGNDA